MKDQIREFIRLHLETFNGDTSFSDSLDIFANGLVDSVFALDLILFVEREFDIMVREHDLQLSNFSSVDAIAAFIVRQQHLRV